MTAVHQLTNQARRHVRRAAVALTVSMLLLAAGTSAHETDQYSVRAIDIHDSTDLLNQAFNNMLARIADEWLWGPDRRAFAKQVFAEMGGIDYIDHYERWIRRNPEVDLVRLPRQQSIYRGGPFWETRVVFFFGLGPILRVNDQLVGADKISHFLSLGWKYYKRSLKGVGEDAVVGIGKRNEAGIFGIWTTGVFSNADLVANYEGFRFYLSLFEEDVVAGKPALIEWLGAGARLQRDFDWRDHVNAYWDEALNPSLFDPLLRDRVSHHLEQLCALYDEMPGQFEFPEDDELAERYAHLGLRDSSQYRLSAVCGVETARATGDSDATDTSNQP